MHQLSQGNAEDAMMTFEKATKLFPEHHRPWQFLSQAYRSHHEKGFERKAAEADEKAKDLCSDPQAQNTVARALARDFWIYGCQPSRLLMSPD